MRIESELKLFGTIEIAILYLLQPQELLAEERTQNTKLLHIKQMTAKNSMCVVDTFIFK